MLRGAEKLITYIILVVVFVFGIVFLTRQIGLTSDLKHSLSQVKTAGIQSGDLNNIAQLHSASAKVFFLTFFSLCILLIGILIIIRGIEKAYDISEVKEKVRQNLKATTPGVVMVVLASFLLAFCSYKTSNIETVYSDRLVDYNNYKIAMHGWNQPAPTTAQAVKVDSSMVKRLKDKPKRVAVDVPDVQKKVDPKYAKPQKPTLVPVPAPVRPAATVAKQEVKTPAAKPAVLPPPAAKSPQDANKAKLAASKPAAPVARPVAAPAKPASTPAPKTATSQKPAVSQKPVAATKTPVAQKPAATQKTAATTQPSVSKKPVATAKPADTKKPVATAKSAASSKQPAIAATAPAKKTVAKKPVATDKKEETSKLAQKAPARAPREEEAKPVVDDKPVSREDMAWADQFQKNVTVYGYSATKSEEARYDRVRRHNEKHDGNTINGELKWAYSFLQKTKKGYEPKPGELRRYEEIIQRSVNTSAVPSKRQQRL